MALNHNHVIYDNFVLENEIEDQFNSHLDLLRFVTVDRSLVGVAGDIKKIRRYRATDATEQLEMGAGNSKNIEISYADEQYQILLLQNRFPYYDEEQMRDPNTVPVGVNHMATDMFNASQKRVMNEFCKGTLKVNTTNYDFAAFVDAVAKLDLPEDEDAKNAIEIFGFVNAQHTAELRKQLKDDLKYVEAFVRKGYIGTVAGVNLYTKKDAPTNYIVIGTRKAVTYFVKKGTEVEQDRDKNVRLNKIYSRKYFVPALTDETQTVRIIKGADYVGAGITNTALWNGTVGSAYKGSASFTGDGTTKAFVLTDKPAAANITSVKVDGVAKTLDTDFTYDVTTGTITFGTAPANTKVVAVEYSYALALTGTATVKCAIERGVLPAGISLSEAGVFSGTPTAAGTYVFSVIAENGYGVASKEFKVVIAAE